MAKRKVFLHVGMPGVGDVVDTAVQRHRRSLAELDVLVPTKAREESFRAAIEVRRWHREWGYQRKEVEGAWSGICRRALKGRSTVLVSQTALAGATSQEIDLLTSQLPGLQLHVVITATAPDGWSEPGDPEHDLASVVQRWADAVRRPERLHVIVTPGTEAREETWRALGEVVGFGTRSLGVDDLEPSPLPPTATAPRPLDGPSHQRLLDRASTWQRVIADREHHVVGDPSDLLPPHRPTSSDRDGSLLRTTRALAEARREVERLARRNESLEARVVDLEQTPRRWRRPA